MRSFRLVMLGGGRSPGITTPSLTMNASERCPVQKCREHEADEIFEYGLVDGGAAKLQADTIESIDVEECNGYRTGLVIHSKRHRCRNSCWHGDYAPAYRSGGILDSSTAVLQTGIVK